MYLKLNNDKYEVLGEDSDGYYVFSPAGDWMLIPLLDERITEVVGAVSEPRNEEEILSHWACWPNQYEESTKKFWWVCYGEGECAPCRSLIRASGLRAELMRNGWSVSGMYFTYRDRL
jgi:hypothetical protein